MRPNIPVIRMRQRILVAWRCSIDVCYPEQQTNQLFSFAIGCQGDLLQSGKVSLSHDLGCIKSHAKHTDSLREAATPEGQKRSPPDRCISCETETLDHNVVGGKL